MTALDFIILIPLVYFGYQGFRKGLIVEISSFLALIIGLIGAFKLMYVAADYLQQNFEINSKYLPFLGFLLVFLVLIFAVHFVGKMVEKLLKLVALGLANRLAGLAFGLIKGTFVVSIILWLLSQIQFFKADTLANSELYGFFNSFAPDVLNLVGNIVPFASELLDQISSFFDKLVRP